MSAYPRTFDELYVISDLHMGGRRNSEQNFQIFNQGVRLSRFISYVADQREEGHVALVLNGDVFDSLAEEDIGGCVALDAASALRMLDHLYSDEAFAPVWEALASFIAKPRRHLVFVIGNHDIELALPVVEDSIRDRLAHDNTDAWARIVFSVHGGGFACQVGNARAFCTHGNELDEWNWIDYSALGQLANAINAGRRVEPSRWKGNAGTRLVIGVMNAVKRRFPFVDLLKPEVAAVASVVLMLEPSLLRQLDLSGVLPILKEKRRGRRVTGDLLGAYAWQDIRDEPPTLDEVAQALLGNNVRGLVSGFAATVVTEDELLVQVENDRRIAWTPHQESVENSSRLETMSGGVDTLAATDWLFGKLGLVSPPERLRRALQDWLADDRTFEVQDFGDELYTGMERRVGETVDFVVTGHTHKARAMTYPSGCHYYNAGTWIRVLRLTKEVLEDSRFFEHNLWPVLQRGRMGDLDAATIPGPDGELVPLVLDRTNAVRIVADGKTVAGDLLRVRDDGAGGINVSPEEGTTTLEARS